MIFIRKLIKMPKDIKKSSRMLLKRVLRILFLKKISLALMAIRKSRYLLNHLITTALSLIPKKSNIPVRVMEELKRETLLVEKIREKVRAKAKRPEILKVKIFMK